METRPGLAREEDKHKVTPMHMAVQWDKIDVLRVLLEHDWSLGYVLTSNGNPILASVASRGYVGAARELLKHCPDAPYAPADGIAQMLLPQMLLPNPQIVLPMTCLHQAIKGGHMELLFFIKRSLDDVYIYIHYLQIQYNNISLNICFNFSSYYKSMFLIFFK